MAANKFATMLHRNTNKMTLILVYAVLEWILILLLLLNSLFSYLIIKYAEYFGLKPPCPWCSKLHQIFDPTKVDNRDFLCEAHSKEISELGFCSNHRKLSETRQMCVDCLPELNGSSKTESLLFPDFGMDQNDVVSLNCSCCGVSLNDTKKNNNNLYMLVNSSSWAVLECAQKDNLITFEEEDCVSSDDKKVGLDFVATLCDGEKALEIRNEGHFLAEFDSSSYLEVNEEGKEENGCVSVTIDDGLKGGEDEKVDEVLEMEEKRELLKEENHPRFVMKDKSVQVCFEEYCSPLEISPKHLEFFLDFSGHKLVPVELIDSIAEENNIKENVKAEVGDMGGNKDFCLDSEIGVEKKEELVDVDINEVPKFAVLESMEMEEDENSLVFHAKDYNLLEDFEQFTAFSASRVHCDGDASNNVEEPAYAAGDVHSDVHSACEDVTALANNENEADVSIGTEIPDLDAADEMQNEESRHSYEYTHQDHPTTVSANDFEPDDQCSMKIEEQMVEFQTLAVKDIELNEIEEDKVPGTPTYMDNLNQLHKKLMFLEKRDSESLDGSVTSELDGGDGVVTIEGLKSALRAERKALQVLYSELEEERSASAVAASQTMAMINRLQEEKAAMQMEALQYQRMMEEQSEYDQEALQLLNELMVKREKEKHELEKELEVYRKKLTDYERKEKMRVLSKDGSTRSGFSSASCSNAEDSDGMSIDLNQEAKEEEGFYSHREYVNHSTPVDAVVNLEDSVADFEEERLSILEQLKVLEEKLITLDESEESHFEDVQALYNSDEENGNHADENGDIRGGTNGHGNGFSNGKHQTRRIPGQKGRSLLPLFDAISDENGDVVSNGNGNGNGVYLHESEFETEKKKLAVEEEVDHLYERLQALEADREFLKHCISSLKKGDKGMDLLQEILQHLRDLRNVELRVRNLSDGPVM